MNVAVVGGGISGAVAAAALCEGGLRVTVFDQGRRGAGGRASHRSVTADATAVLADDEPLSESDESTLEFDHGCQFFRADEPRFAELVARWCEQGWAAQWCGRFHQLPVPKASSAETHADPDTNTNTNTRPKTTASSHPRRDPSDFFGLPESPGGPVYVGVGGMQRLVRAILTESRATLCRGQRVAEVRHAPSQGHAPSHGRWELLGTSGESAFHDTSVSATPHTLGTFDAILFTDASSALGSWHRASAGLPPELGEELARRVARRVRVPLFTCMVALERPLGAGVDGFTAPGSDALWFAARSQSKPGGVKGAKECWTLVSTPGYAVAQITETPMQDPQTGAFRPQEDSYLNSIPGPRLFEAFTEALAPRLRQLNLSMPALAYLQAQRWGSAMPAPVLVGGRDACGRSASTVHVCGIPYEATLPPLVYPRPEGAKEADFCADHTHRAYYAGDFTSSRCPGFEAAALSALDAAEAMLKALTSDE